VRAGSGLVVVASIGTLALLWAFRPSLGQLPRSLGEPLTATSVEKVGLVLAWLALAFLALAILVQGLRSIARSRTRFVRARERLGWRPSGSEPSPEHERARHSTSRASMPRLSGFPDQVVLTVRPPIETPATNAKESRVEAAHEAPAIAVSVLGPLRVTGVKRRRRLRGSSQELVAYLALHPEGATRDQLLEALWPGEDPKRSEQRLWQSTSDVRRALGPVINRTRDRYSLNRHDVRVDLDEIERLLAAAKQTGPDRPVIEHALTLFVGEPLAGSDYRWAEGELRRLRATYIDLLEGVARHRLEAGEARAALDAAERGLECDALNESLWRVAMEAENALGLREAVTERYERLRSLLDERLGLQPARETRHLHRNLLAQD
jgi:DNA-binding SARP family transcriptional activator